MDGLFDATRDLKALADLAGRPEAIADVLERALDSLGQLVPHDLAVVLGVEEQTLRVLAARGPLACPAVREHALALAEHPSLRRALEERRALVLTEDHHAHGEGDPYEGVVDLPRGHSCMVVPLYAGERVLGAMTFDRKVCGTYDPRAVELAEVYGKIISLAFLYAEQAELLQRQRARLEERSRVLDEAGGGTDATGLLERSLSPAMRRLVAQARQVAAADAPVLVRGETGTGKEILARALHDWSPRRGEPFLQLNCAAIPENLIESELFGHVRGAFSGADRDRPGRFLAANGGTLLLDEVGDMPLAAQAKLLRVLQEGTFEPVGSDAPVKVDVRIVAATRRDLERAVRKGEFREDLFYRLEVFPLEVPPLRDRTEDLEVLATGVLDRIARRTGRGPWRLSERALRALRAEPWPGNVRQLVNVLERATILKPAGVLDASTVRLEGPRRRRDVAAAAPEDLPTLREVERRHVIRALERTEGKIYGPDGAAALLGLKPTTLQSRMRRLGVERRIVWR